MGLARLILVCLGLLCPVNLVQGQYTITDLGSHSNDPDLAPTIDATNGTSIAGAFATNGTYHAYVTTDGAKTDIGTIVPLNPSLQSFTTAMNAAGEVVGNYQTPWPGYGAINRAFRYNGVAVTDVGNLGGEQAFAYGINSHGDVVGEAQLFSQGSDLTGPYHAFLSADGFTIDLGTLQSSDTESRATALNDSDVVVGFSGQPSQSGGYSNGFIYRGGQMTSLGNLGGTITWPEAINNSNVVVGYSYLADGDSRHGFIWSSNKITDVGTLGGPYSFLWSINDLGVAVGQSRIDTNPGHYDAMIYSNGTLTDLNSLLPANSGWLLTNAVWIGDSGEIVGYGINPSGQADGFMLTPTPEPSAVCLFCITLVALHRRRRSSTRRPVSVPNAIRPQRERNGRTAERTGC